MVGRKELSRGLVALIAEHEQLSEIVMESAVIVNDGGEEQIDHAEHFA